MIKGDTMRFLRHLLLLFKEFCLFAWHKKAWWLIPIVVILLLLGALIFISEATAPFIYTLF